MGNVTPSSLMMYILFFSHDGFTSAHSFMENLLNFSQLLCSATTDKL